MKRFFKQQQPHTNYCTSVVEAETILKNEASPKSLTSRGNNIKKVVLLFVLAYVSVGMWAQSKTVTKIPEHPTSTDSIKFFGSIKSVKEMSYEASEKFGEVSKGKINYKKEYQCDDKGTLTEHDYYHRLYDYDNLEYKNEYESEKTIIKYNKNGERIERSIYTNEQLKSTIQWKYDEKGNLVEQNTYGSDKILTSKIKQKYNDKDKCVEESEYDSHGNTISKELFDYDARGYYTGHTKYENGKLTWKCVHELDDKGNQIHNTRTASDGSILFVRNYKYDAKGNRIDYEEFSDDGNFGVKPFFHKKISWKYDDKGNLMEFRDHERLQTWSQLYFFQKYNSDGYIISSHGTGYDEGGSYKYKRKYDDRGNCTEELLGECYVIRCDDVTVPERPLIEDVKTGVYVWSNEKAKQIDIFFDNQKESDFDEKTEYVYTYDKYGNWITKTVYEYEINSLPTCTKIIEREIEYYEN